MHLSMAPSSPLPPDADGTSGRCGMLLAMRRAHWLQSKECHGTTAAAIRHVYYPCRQATATAVTAACRCCHSGTTDGVHAFVGVDAVAALIPMHATAIPGLVAAAVLAAVS